MDAEANATCSVDKENTIISLTGSNALHPKGVEHLKKNGIMVLITPSAFDGSFTPSARLGTDDSALTMCNRTCFRFTLMWKREISSNAARR